MTINDAIETLAMALQDPEVQQDMYLIGQKVFEEEEIIEFCRYIKLAANHQADYNSAFPEILTLFSLLGIFIDANKEYATNAVSLLLSSITISYYHPYLR